MEECEAQGLPAPHRLESSGQRPPAKRLLRLQPLVQAAAEPLGVQVLINRQVHGRLSGMGCVLWAWSAAALD